MAQRPWQGHHDTYQHRDDRKDDSAQRVIGQCVEDFCPGKDVEADQKDVVGEQHEPGEFISDLALPKGVVSKITYFAANTSVPMWPLSYRELLYG